MSPVLSEEVCGSLKYVDSEKEEVVMMMSLAKKRIHRLHVANDGNYKRMIINAGGRLLVVAVASWCPDSRRMVKEILPQYVKRYGKQMKFILAEIEGVVRGEKPNPLMENFLGVERYPTLYAFIDGECVMPKISEEKERQQQDIVELLSLLGVMRT